MDKKKTYQKPMTKKHEAMRIVEGSYGEYYKSGGYYGHYTY